MKNSLDNEFKSSKNSDEKRLKHSKSDNEEIKSGFNTKEIIEELFYSLFQGYQIGLKQSKKGSEFVFDYDEGFFYKYHDVSLNCVESYIYSPKWLN